MSGLLGTRSSTSGDLNLFLQIFLLVLLLIGFKFGRTKTTDSFKKHERIMTIAIILNAGAFLLFMGPIFISAFKNILAEPFKIGFPLTSLHHSFGIAAEIFGITLVFRKFGTVRIWMRLTMALWLTAAVLGITLYVFYFVLS